MQSENSENYNLDSKNYETKYKKETETNTVNCSLTKANTWLVDYSNTYSYDTNTTSDTQESVEPNLDEFDYQNIEGIDNPNSASCKLAKDFLEEQIKYVKDEIKKKKDQEQANTITNTQGNTIANTVEPQPTNVDPEVTGTISALQYVNSTRMVGLNKKTITTTTTNKYTQGTPETKLKTDADSDDPNFITLLNKYGSARSSLYELSEWLFTSFEKDENTADMIDLTKYLFNVQSKSNKYGDISEDDILDWLKKSSFSSVSASSALIEWICCNENENLYNFLHYDGPYNATYVNTHVTADKKEYIVMPDAGKELANNRNYGFGVLIYNDGAYNNVTNFADHGIDITKPEYNKEGSKISVEIVDAITKKIINEDKARIKNEASSYGVTLDDAQIAVLLDIKYQWGNIGNFFEVYKNAGQDRNKTSIRDFQAYDENGNLGGKPLDGVEYVGRENRRWKLFSEGIFETDSGRIITPSAGMDASAEGIVESAKALVELTQSGGAEQIQYDKPRTAKNSDFHIDPYVCASFVSEVLYNSTGFTNWHAGVDGLGRNLYNDSNYELIYYKRTSNSVSDGNGVTEFSGDVNINQNIENIIQPGDVVASYSSEYKYKHIVVYIGDGQYAHHGGGTGTYNFPHISSNFFSSYNSSTVKYIFRYKG